MSFLGYIIDEAYIEFEHTKEYVHPTLYKYFEQVCFDGNTTQR